MSAALEEFEMPSKRSGTPAEPTATYSEWRARCAALLERQGISAGAIPEKLWRVLYVNRRATPEQAAEEARVHYENFIRRPSFARASAVEPT
jgi:hypothetical protein